VLLTLPGDVTVTVHVGLPADVLVLVTLNPTVMADELSARVRRPTNERAEDRKGDEEGNYAEQDVPNAVTSLAGLGRRVRNGPRGLGRRGADGEWLSRVCAPVAQGPIRNRWSGLA
jgi:hypothetical protein